MILMRKKADFNTKSILWIIITIWMMINLIFATGAQAYEAEDAYCNDGAIESEHSGYSGNGYVNTANASGSPAWLLKAPPILTVWT